MVRLRSPNGCPWDREQTFESLRTFLLEETYELLETIDEKNPAHQCEELGDVLFQVVFQAQIAAENGLFSINEVIDSISRKLVRRHPHVFGQTTVKDSAEVASNWEELKKIENAEKGAPETQSLLDRVPRALPALLETHRISQRAATVGFDWQQVSQVLEKVREEYDELQQALTTDIRGERQNAIAWELGDLLFTLGNLARHLNLCGEDLLRQANLRFRKRFKKVEKLACAQGIDLANASLDTLETLWQEAKQLV